MVRIVVFSCLATLALMGSNNNNHNSAAEAFAPKPFMMINSDAKSYATSPPPSTRVVVLSMGLFDFFSEDARKEREAKKEAEIAEQERLQKEILKRRANPEAMEEYEARVAIRRRAIARGEDGSKYKVMVEDDDE
jgi:hypothetical protein